MTRSTSERAILLLSGMLLAACESIPDPFDYNAFCGGIDNRDWELVGALPAESQRYRELADRHPNFKTDPWSYSVESWFVSPSGEIMLCRSDGSPNNSCFGEWWQFDDTGDELRIAEQDGWLCVT